MIYWYPKIIQGRMINMTLGELLQAYGTFCKLNVYELGGAPVSIDVISAEIPSQFWTRDVVKFYPFDNVSITVTIEED